MDTNILPVIVIANILFQVVSCLLILFMAYLKLQKFKNLNVVRFVELCLLLSLLWPLFLSPAPVCLLAELLSLMEIKHGILRFIL